MILKGRFILWSLYYVVLYSAKQIYKMLAHSFCIDASEKNSKKAVNKADAVIKSV